MRSILLWMFKLNNCDEIPFMVMTSTVEVKVMNYYWWSQMIHWDIPLIWLWLVIKIVYLKVLLSIFVETLSIWKTNNCLTLSEKPFNVLAVAADYHQNKVFSWKYRSEYVLVIQSFNIKSDTLKLRIKIILNQSSNIVGFVPSHALNGR